jgi:hypothetical protein
MDLAILCLKSLKKNLKIESLSLLKQNNINKKVNYYLILD